MTPRDLLCAAAIASSCTTLPTSHKADRLEEAGGGLLPGAGRSPANKGHGWPAPALAVGPAQGDSQTVDIIRNADLLFAVLPLQGLPPCQSQVNLKSLRELIA